MVTPYRLLLGAYFGLCTLVIIWNVAAAGRIVQNRRMPASLAGTTAFGALLLIPGLIIAVSDASLVYGRAVQTVSWLWPAVLVLFAAQAILSLARARVNPLLGVPIVIYDLLLAIVGIARYCNSIGIAPPHFTLVLSAAQTNALGIIAGSAALSHATWLLVPMFSPAQPSRSRIKMALRTFLTAGVTVATALVLVELPAAAEAISSYDRYTGDILTDRGDAGFLFGLKVFPDLRAVPPVVAAKSDLPLADSLGTDAISIVVDPEGARGKALDSLSRLIDNIRDDSTTLIVTLGYSRDARDIFARSPASYVDERLSDVNRITRALRPNVFVPAYEPYGEGARALGTQPPQFWIGFVERAAAIAHHVNPHIRVAVAASSFGSRDSVLYAWAASRNSPVDLVGLSLMPGFDGATSLDTHMRIAQRWIRAYDRPKPHWVLAAGGYPIVHGEASQTLALRGVLAWATAQVAVQGVIVTDAGDYDAQRGLRAPDGRFRPAITELSRAITGEHEAGSK